MKFKNLIFGIVMLMCIGMVSAGTVTLNSPNGTSYLTNETISFNCSVDTGVESISQVEIYSNTNQDDFLSLYTFEKGSFSELGDGTNISIDYIDEFSPITDNPTYIIDSEGDTCIKSSGDPCLLFNSTAGSYFVGSVNNRYFDVTFNDTFLLKRIEFLQHSTFYSNDTTIIVSVDGINWETAFDGATPANWDYTFTEKYYVKYMRLTSNDYNNGMNWYVTYMNITGQKLLPKTFNNDLIYNYPVSIGGGDYNWNCKAIDSSTNYFATTNNTFTINGTTINYVEPTPTDGSSQVHLKLNTSITSDYETYSFYDINDSIIAWWPFTEVVLGEYTSYKPDLPSIPLVGSSALVSARFGNALKPTNTNYARLSQTINYNEDGFSLMFIMSIDNNTVLDNEDIIVAQSTTGGYRIRMDDISDDNFHLNILYWNTTGDYTNANILHFNKSDYNPNSTQKYLFTIDTTATTSLAKLFINGTLVDTSVRTFTQSDWFARNPSIFQLNRGVEGLGIEFDEVLIINRTLTDSEAEALTGDSMLVNFENQPDFTFTSKAYAVDTNNILSETETRTLTFLQAPVIDYTDFYPNSSINYEETAYVYCNASYDGVDAETVGANIYYSTNQNTWTQMTSTFQDITQTFAVIGDSMSGTSDWVTPLANYFNVPTSKLPSYAIPGNSCPAIWNQLNNSVINDTNNLFLTCGVNSFIGTNNTYWWETMYNLSKDKGIDNVYMTTMPPWNHINTLNATESVRYCDKMKAENEWLISFAGEHDDLIVNDLWTYFHDTSGTNQTDCGFRTDITYTSDGVHPNTAGNIYWAEQYWKNFNHLTNNTYMSEFTAPSLESNTDYYFQCSSDYDGRSGLAQVFGPLMINADPNYGVNPGAREGVRETLNTAFIAFALMALFAIVGSAMILISIFGQGGSSVTLIAAGTAFISLAIILFVGYIILGSVASGLLYML